MAWFTMLGPELPARHVALRTCPCKQHMLSTQQVISHANKSLLQCSGIMFAQQVIS